MNVSFENVVEVEDTSCTLVNILSTHLFLLLDVKYCIYPTLYFPSLMRYTRIAVSFVGKCDG